MTKIGRNEPCPCGSGLKYKRCCETARDKPGLGARLAIVLILAILAGGFLLVFKSYDGDDAGTQRVWSSEHGHWHEVPGP